MCWILTTRQGTLWIPKRLMSKETWISLVCFPDEGSFLHFLLLIPLGDQSAAGLASLKD